MLGVRHNTNGFIYCPLYVGSWRGVLSATRLIDCSVPSVFTIFQFNDIIFHYCMHDYDDDDDDGCYIDLVYSLTFQIAFGAEPLASKIIPFHFTTLPFPVPTAQYYIIAYHLLNIHLRPLTSSLPQPITIDESLAERQVHAEEEAFFESGGDGFSPTSQRDDYAAVNTASSLMMMRCSIFHIIAVRVLHTTFHICVSNKTPLTMMMMYNSGCSLFMRTADPSASTDFIIRLTLLNYLTQYFLLYVGALKSAV